MTTNAPTTTTQGAYPMKTMLLGFLACAVLTVGAYFALQQIGFSAADRASSPAVRLD